MGRHFPKKFYIANKVDDFLQDKATEEVQNSLVSYLEITHDMILYFLLYILYWHNCPIRASNTS